MRAEQPLPVGERSIFPGRMQTELEPASPLSVSVSGPVNWQDERWFH